jgi:hypothetical protein
VLCTRPSCSSPAMVPSTYVLTRKRVGSHLARVDELGGY